MVTAKIPYIVLKDGDFYFDVVKDMEVSHDLALQLVSRYVK